MPLTCIEQKLLGKYRPNRMVICMKPATYGATEEGLSQLAHRGHVIATPNSGVDLIRDCMLEHPSCLSEVLQIVFLVLVKSDNPVAIDKAVRRMIAKSPALHIRGLEVLKWAFWLCDVSLGPCRRPLAGRCMLLESTVLVFGVAAIWVRAAFPGDCGGLLGTRRPAAG